MNLTGDLKGEKLYKKAKGIEIEYSDRAIGRVFDSYGNIVDGKPFTSEKRKLQEIKQ